MLFPDHTLLPFEALKKSRHTVLANLFVGDIWILMEPRSGRGKSSSFVNSAFPLAYATVLPSFFSDKCHMFLTKVYSFFLLPP